MLVKSRFIPLTAISLFLALTLSSCFSSKHGETTIDRIQQRGVLLAGTTGDYRPLSYLENDSTYWGFEIDLAGEIAQNLGVNVEFVTTSWPTLTDDVLAEPQTFDFAISGITPFCNSG